MEPAHHVEPVSVPTSPAVPATAASSVLVVGAGLAGLQTVAALRAHGFAGTVRVLGAEALAPYDRPPLSKELFSRREPAWLSAELGADLDALADEVLLDDAAVALERDASTSTVVTASGRRHTADVVVLACGSTPLRPPGWEAAVTLHTAADAAHLREALAPGTRLVCIGAGWIGAEVAGAAAQAGCTVTVVEAAEVPLHRQLGTQVGAALAPWYPAAGVRLLTGSSVTGVDAGGVHLSSLDGTASATTLPADVVLAAVGARPATDWLAGAVPRDARGAVRVDAAGRVLEDAGTTAAPGAPAPLDQDPDPDGSLRPGVYAVGDCATREDPVWAHVPGGHWSAALLDPDAVARGILGLAATSRHAPYVFSTQLGHDLALFGMPDPATDAVVLRGDPTLVGSGWSALYVGGDGRVTGICVVDSPKDVGAARKVMAGGPVRLDLDRAGDPLVALRSTVR